MQHKTLKTKNTKDRNLFSQFREVTVVSDIIYRKVKSFIHLLNTLILLSHRRNLEQVISPSQG